MRYGASLRLDVVKERLGREAIRTTINIYGHLLPNVDAALADAPLRDIRCRQRDARGTNVAAHAAR
jgi:hypothetical protein